MLAKVQKALILHTFLVGWYNGTATLENSLVVFKKKNKYSYHMTCQLHP